MSQYYITFKMNVGPTGMWEKYLGRAKQLEQRLEKKLQTYSSIAQRINAEFYDDEESNLLRDDRNEQQYTTEIESDLNDLNDCIQHMRQVTNLSFFM